MEPDPNVSAVAIRRDCDGCGVAIAGDDVDGFLDAYVVHVAEAHADWGYSDKAVRAYARRWRRWRRRERRGEADGVRTTR